MQKLEFILFEFRNFKTIYFDVVKLQKRNFSKKSYKYIYIFFRYKF